jgi:hypothetical protein
MTTSISGSPHTKESAMQQSENALVAHLRGCIDLGRLGVLLAPVTVQGKTYMALADSGSSAHDWHGYRSMKWIQQQFFGGNTVTEHSRICECQGYQLCLPTDAELVAIHQHFSAAPPAWVNYTYWSASPRSPGHAVVDFVYGFVYDNGDDSDGNYVAFEVL